ncbi:Aldehyde:ferredoxin oxidoreductase [Archaeoglobus sulfaticallidus PM70-1]|uniref:Aldehyde:ferredoxin oxidoreductase n=1 Tax=Archaeoglobus sulfaticallidus PM70-1 TaxID=387631 RepID=N0BKB8_9EURY|nr:aldehyde ferredoxin oxidoreductase family protein [Archaeoglobus sulfaticallidus]AGK60605.1 Aldehyde:ferredoxin oxidoreductase [Archaeoglobus sulfaticallidus PM70-1]
MNIARINLSKGTITVSKIPSDLKPYIGGKGIATKLLFGILPKVDPFHPDNAIIFGIGPVNGIRLSGASRVTAVFKSPLTFGYGESQCGGYLAYEMKKAGIDFLYITGKARKPVYISVEDRNIEIKDASHLWGKDSYETEEILEKEEGGEILSIGQAGENLVRFACINHRKGRQFGRGGAGAVMGSKMLKAIVVKGSGEVEVADSDRLREFRKWMLENVVSKLEGMKRYGTLGIANLTNEAGVLPTKYWERGSFEELEKINAEAFDRYTEKSTACYGCAVSCGKIRKAGDVEVEGPEYETLYAFGPLCYNSDAESIFRANDLCDRYGMDTISAGNVVAFYMACSERGEVDERVDFGDSNAILELLKKIAFRQDIGDILAEGSKIASERMGVSVEAVHVKGLEPPGYDPRGLYSMALAYVTSHRGACHMRSCAYRPNLTGAVDRFSVDKQAELVKDLEDFYCVVDSFVFCRFLCLPVIGMYWQDIARLYEIVTGNSVSVEDLKKAGESIWNLTREFNLREGVVDENLPSTFFRPVKHYDRELVVRKEDFDRMVEKYRSLRGL